MQAKYIQEKEITGADAEVLDADRVVYTLCVADIQCAAVAKLGRKLTADEIGLVEHRLSKVDTGLDDTIRIIIGDLQDDGKIL